MNYKATLQTKNKTAGVNTCQFIVLHHTATGEDTIKGVLKTLTTGAVSCHYVVDTNGDVYKIGEDKDILWHAGASAWGNLTDLNRFSIGIETIWPLSDGGFTDAQRDSVGKLVIELSKKYWIWKGNILRHKDIAPARKTDIADTFWNKQFKSFDEYKAALFSNASKPMIAKSKYADIRDKVLADTKFNPIFDKHEGDTPLTEAEVKDLIEIAFARFAQRNGLK